MNNDNDNFDEIMEKVGYDGRFQRIYNWIYVTGLTFCGAMICMNLILALNVPDHWCHVPEIEKTNFTLDEWRTMALPKKVDSRGEVSFSECSMYNLNYTEIQHWDYENWNFSSYEVIDCINGYQYDRQWYEETIVTRENWVCKKDLYVTNTFVVSRVAEVLGTLVFGQLGDTLGRRIVFYTSLIFVTLGRFISILTTSSYTIFIITTGIAAITINSLFQSPLIIAMEISKDDDRTSIAMAQNLGWSIGTSFMPLLFWWLRDWKPFMWITSIPTAAILLFHKYMIESPRWLISKRRFGEALEQFRVIAKVNGRKFDLTEKELTEKYSKFEEENVYGLMSLFSGWRISRNTLIMAFSWCVVSVSYFTLLLASSSMGGNPFLNFLLQSIVEVPAYVVGKYSGDRIGRRLTNSFCFIVSGISCIPLFFFSTDKKFENIVVIVATFIKFLNGITFFVVGLQAMELYPTCLRQTGISLGALTANAVGVLSPYFVYLGTTYDVRYPYCILCALFFMGGITGFYLPETLHQKLPDSLEGAKKFGKYQKFWSLPRPPKSRKVSKNDLENEQLNQKQFQP